MPYVDQVPERVSSTLDASQYGDGHLEQEEEEVETLIIGAGPVRVLSPVIP